MSLMDQIHREERAQHDLQVAIDQTRTGLYEAHFVTKHDARRRGESDTHWHRRRRRNRERYERRDEVVEHLVRKREAHEKLEQQLRRHRREFREERADHSSHFVRGSTRIVIFDGKSVVEDAAYWLSVIRARGLWGGVLVSGYRTPAYSTQLCLNMCGNPYCPGRCAGASSNHAKTTYPGPAVDVTDYYRCEDALIDVGSGYFNDLPLDPVHMSKSGH